MKRALILAGALIAFATAAISASVAFADDAAPSSPPKPEAPKSSEGGEGGEGGAKSKGPTDVSGGRFAGDPVYVHLTPMFLPIISDAGVEQIVTLQIDVEVKDFDVADAMHANMPRVMDALMRALYGGLGQGSLRNGKLVDVTKVKTKATAALDSVVPGGGILNVLVQGVSQRML